MKSKKIAVLMISATLAMGTVGATAVLASPPAMGGEQFGGGQGPSGPGFNGEAPQAPDGQSFNGEAPQAPDGQSFNGETPQAPDGQSFNGEAPQAPNGQAPNGQPQGMPNSENMVKVTAIENGSATVEIRNMSNPGDTSSETDLETKNYDFSTAEIVKESNGQRETASLNDITNDSMVELELNEDGSVKNVVIKEKPAEMPNDQTSTQTE